MRTIQLKKTAAPVRTMSTQVTLTLPDGLFERAQNWAARMGQPLDCVLTQAIESSLAPLGSGGADTRPVAQWTEEEVLAAADLQMTPTDDQRMSQLLGDQQARRLNAAEQTELSALMTTYQDGLLRKAQAVAEAVRRGLREPVRP